MRLLGGFIFIIVVGVGSIYSVNYYKQTRPETHPDYRFYQAARTAVLGRLKAPATAIFQPFAADAVAHVAISANDLTLNSKEIVTRLEAKRSIERIYPGVAVTLIVDAQNGFGALIRSRYRVEYACQREGGDYSLQRIIELAP